VWWKNNFKNCIIISGIALTLTQVSCGFYLRCNLTSERGVVEIVEVGETMCVFLHYFVIETYFRLECFVQLTVAF